MNEIPKNLSRMILVFLLLFWTSARANDDIYSEEREFYNPSLESTEQISKNPKLVSVLDRRFDLDGFGSIAYRGPLESHSGPVVVLFHGIYGGVSHRAYRELLPLLDQAGYQVFIMDLPGVGLSSKPKKKYDIEVVDRFIVRFLSDIVKEPAHVVAASTVTTSALYVAAKNADLFNSLSLLSPVGASSLKSKPGFFQKLATRFSSRFKSGEVSPYQNLLTPKKIQYYLGLAYSKPSFIDDDLIEESQIQQANIDQRWLTYSFISGLIFRSFAEAASGLDHDKVPTQALFGDTIKSFRPVRFLPFGSKPETIEGFQAIDKSINYHQIEDCGSVLWREKPVTAARLISGLINQTTTSQP